MLIITISTVTSKRSCFIFPLNLSALDSFLNSVPKEPPVTFYPHSPSSLFSLWEQNNRGLWFILSSVVSPSQLELLCQSSSQLLLSQYPEILRSLQLSLSAQVSIPDPQSCPARAGWGSSAVPACARAPKATQHPGVALLPLLLSTQGLAKGFCIDFRIPAQNIQWHWSMNCSLSSCASLPVIIHPWHLFFEICESASFN